jgi:hypothetical protein
VQSRCFANHLRNRVCGLMSRMKLLVLVLVQFGLSTCPFLAPSLYSQTLKRKTECSPLFKAEWIQLHGDTVDEVTACADGELMASHTFNAPAFGSTPPERTTWRYNGQIDKNLVADLSKTLHRKEISVLPIEIDLGVKGVPNAVLHEQDQVAHFSISQEKTEQKITLQNIPGIYCGDKPAQVEEAVWDLICLYRDLYARAKSGDKLSSGNCGCKSLNDMANTNASTAAGQK